MPHLSTWTLDFNNLKNLMNNYIKTKFWKTAGQILNYVGCSFSTSLLCLFTGIVLGIGVSIKLLV